MELELPKPKLKRKRGAGSRVLPAEKEKEEASCKCTGVLVGGSVLVQNSADVTAILNKGFYGKAVFSRSVPTHVQTAYTRHTLKSSSEECSGSGGFEPLRKRTRVVDEAFRSDSEEEGKRWKGRLLLHAQWREEKEKNLPSLGRGHNVVSKGISGTGGKDFLERSSVLPAECSVGVEDSSNSEKMELEDTEGEIMASEGRAATTGLVEPPEVDLYPVVEPLCLTGEEAFYLVAELELLTVHPPTDEKSYTAEELWKELCTCCKRFPFTYSAYHHYRKRGWVPKSGFKFGVDFILYKDGPEFYHSSYAILVCEEFGKATEMESASNTTSLAASKDASPSSTNKLLENLISAKTSISSHEKRAKEDVPDSREDTTTLNSPEKLQVSQGSIGHRSTACLLPSPSSTADTITASSAGVETTCTGNIGSVAEKAASLSLTEPEDCSSPRLRWIDIIAHCRVCESSGKELVVSYVTAPSGWGETRLLLSPECVDHMSLHETLVTRWIPDKDR